MEAMRHCNCHYLLAPIGPIAEWQPNPLEQPGVFAQLPNSVHFTDGVDSLVMVESVNLTDLDSQLALQLSANATLPDSQSTAVFQLDAPPVIHFYPDGSCDSAKVQLADRNTDNPNKEIIELIGLTGSVRREIIEVTPDLSTRFGNQRGWLNWLGHLEKHNPIRDPF